MAEDEAEDAPEAEEEEAPKKGKSKLLLISLALALLLGGGGFYGVYSGLIPLGGGDATADASHGEDGGDGHGETEKDKKSARAYGTPAFVPLEPFIISLGQAATARHLKVSLTVEVMPGTESDVMAAVPRINDVLNTYLRAVDHRDFEVPRAMPRLRAQMLRRVRLVTPPDAVRDLLFQEFVLN